MLKRSNYYVVWKGRRTGIFYTYEEYEPFVSGYSGALHEGFVTEDQAKEAYEVGYEEYLKLRREKEAGLEEPLW